MNGGIRGSFIQLVQKVQLFYAHLSPQTKEEEDFFEKLMLVIIKGTDYTDFTGRIHVSYTEPVLNRVIRA